MREGEALAVPDRRREAAGRLYMPQLDVLRFFAFAMVFCAHLFPTAAGPYVRYGVPHAIAVLIAAAMRAGGFGVDLFFCLSAYLITTLLMREKESFGTVDVKSFYIRRALRIWPLYYCYLAIALALSLAGIAIFVPFSSSYAVAFALFAGNLAIAFCDQPLATPIVVLWSLCIEEQFYFLWPVVIRFSSRNSLRAIGISLILAGIIVRLCLSSAGAGYVQFWFFTLARLDPIGAGVLAATFTLDARKSIGPIPKLAAIATALFCIVGAQLWISVSGEIIAAPMAYALVALSSAAIIILSLRFSTDFGRVARALQYLGKISFGLYVYHDAVIQFSAVIVPGGGAIVLLNRALISIVAVVAMSTMSYEFLEKPFLVWKEKFSRIRSRPA